MTEQQLIEGCRKGDRRSQEALYAQMAPLMYAVCRRYLRHTADAEDALVTGFYKVFTHLKEYSGSGSFEGWIKKIMVNESLMILRKNNALRYAGDIAAMEVEADTRFADSLSDEEIKALVDSLPDGCRTVFNLYAVEGYLHREIAEMLNISINTSKSQLQLAVRKLKEKLGKSYPEAG